MSNSSQLQAIKQRFKNSCDDLKNHQISFYCYVRDGGTDLSNFHPRILDNPHIGEYFKCKEELESFSNEVYTVI